MEENSCPESNFPQLSQNADLGTKDVRTGRRISTKDIAQGLKYAGSDKGRAEDEHRADGCRCRIGERGKNIVRFDKANGECRCSPAKRDYIRGSQFQDKGCENTKEQDSGGVRCECYKVESHGVIRLH
jgi:hypothetical protein